MRQINYLSELLSSVFARDGLATSTIDDHTYEQLCESLLALDVERDCSHISLTLLKRFASANSDEQLSFFQLLAHQYDVDSFELVQASRDYAREQSDARLERLKRQAQPKRQKILSRLNCGPEAIVELLKMRAKLLELKSLHPEIDCLESDFKELFRAWFNPGLLVLQEIDWFAPANILEKIVRLDICPRIETWSDMRQRVQPEDRRCFAFFHPTIDDEPLLFVEVALTRSAPQTLGELLEPARTILDEAEADTAVIYSVTSCHNGLPIQEFGSSLIDQIVRRLSSTLPSLRSFRTLSPVPGLMPWIREKLSQAEHSEDMDCDTEEISLVRQYAAMRLASVVASSNRFDFDEMDKEQLQKLVAHFLLKAKTADYRPVDSEARFHFRNGAILDAVIPCANETEQGLNESAGVMVSYLYNLKKMNRIECRMIDLEVDQLEASAAVKALCEPSRLAKSRA